MRIILLLLIPFFISEQEIKLKKKNIPDNISTAFESKFLNAKKTKWHKNENHFIATFISDRHAVKVTYSKAGDWEQISLKLNLKELPAKVFMSWFQNFYGNWMPRKIEKIETPETQPVYLLEVHQHKMIREIIYDENGKLLKEIIVKQ
jgi:hypothetical protein